MTRKKNRELNMTHELDSITIENFLASFLACSPKYRPYSLSPQSLQDVIQKVKSECVDDASLLDMIGCVFAIAFHYSMAPRFDHDILLSCTSILQTIAMESLLVLIQKQQLDSSKVSLYHPIDFMEYKGSHDDGDDDRSLHDAFQSGMELAKDILRDLTHQIRSARELSIRFKRGKKPKNKLPKDCFQPHSLLFVCSFALAHIVIVTNSQNSINTIPGLMDLIVS
jgi:hypothetical protein